MAETWVDIRLIRFVQQNQEDETPEVTGDLDAESASEGNFVSKALQQALELPGLSALKPSLGGLVETLAANPLLAWAAVAIPAALFLVLLSTLFGGKKASSVVRNCPVMPFQATKGRDITCVMHLYRAAHPMLCHALVPWCRACDSLLACTRCACHARFASWCVSADLPSCHDAFNVYCIQVSIETFA